jgi:hypothetical protein
MSSSFLHIYSDGKKEEPKNKLDLRRFVAGGGASLLIDSHRDLPKKGTPALLELPRALQQKTSSLTAF